MTQISIQIEPASYEDMPQILQLVEPEEFTRDGEGNLLHLDEEHLAKLIGDGNSLVARHDEDVVGHSSVHEYDGIAELRTWVVARPYRGIGIGSALIGECKTRASERNHELLYTLIKTQNTQVFERQDFVSTRTPPEKLRRYCRPCPLNRADLCREQAYVAFLGGVYPTLIESLKGFGFDTKEVRELMGSWLNELYVVHIADDVSDTPSNMILEDVEMFEGSKINFTVIRGGNSWDAAYSSVQLNANGLFLATRHPGVVFNGQAYDTIGHIRAKMLTMNDGQIGGYVSSAVYAIQNGVRDAVIFNGKEPHSLIYAMSGKVGTRIYKSNTGYRTKMFSSKPR